MLEALSSLPPLQKQSSKPSKMSEQRKVYVPIASEAVSLWRGFWAIAGLCFLLLLLVGVPLYISNALFGWPDIGAAAAPAPAQTAADSVANAEQEQAANAEKDTRYRLLVALLSLDKAAGDAVGARMYSLPVEDRISTAEMRQVWETVRAGRTPYQMIEVATPPNHMSKGALLDVFMALEKQMF